MSTKTPSAPAEAKELSAPRPSGSKKFFRKVEPYIWIAPSIILMAIFIVTPIVKVFQLSMSKVTRAGLVKGYNNFENFSKVLKSPAFALVLKNTIVWTIAVVVISTVLGFMLALVLNNKFRGRKAVRAIVVFPWATTLVIQASAWNFIINKDYGTLNTLLMKLGFISPRPRPTLPGRSPAASSSPFPSSASASSPASRASTPPTTRPPLWTEPGTSRSSSASPCPW